MKYTVRRYRAYWVQETQVIEAATAEEAEDHFLDCFDPSLEIKDVFRLHAEQFETPITITAEGKGD